MSQNKEYQGRGLLQAIFQYLIRQSFCGRVAVAFILQGEGLAKRSFSSHSRHLEKRKRGGSVAAKKRGYIGGGVLIVIAVAIIAFVKL
ncbi:hypothetical protein OOJ74_08435, partial [Venenivibrio stagnispumantis]|nr:hypothetical protein [Venenivibrio stagnispumantis]